jgi:hypothetical protein
MSNASNYLENQLIDHLFRTATFAKPTTLYFALFTAVADGDANSVTEVSGGSYARVAVTPLNTNFNGTGGSTSGTSGSQSGTGGNTTNAVQITFPAPTGNWGTVSHYGIYDASTSGNLLIWGVLNSSKTVNSGDAAPSFAVGNLSITVA